MSRDTFLTVITLSNFHFAICTDRQICWGFFLVENRQRLRTTRGWEPPKVKNHQRLRATKGWEPPKVENHQRLRTTKGWEPPEVENHQRLRTTKGWEQPKVENRTLLQLSNGIWSKINFNRKKYFFTHCHKSLPEICLASGSCFLPLPIWAMLQTFLRTWRRQNFPFPEDKLKDRKRK